MFFFSSLLYWLKHAFTVWLTAHEKKGPLLLQTRIFIYSYGYTMLISNKNRKYEETNEKIQNSFNVIQLSPPMDTIIEPFLFFNRWLYFHNYRIISEMFEWMLYVVYARAANNNLWTILILIIIIHQTPNVFVFRQSSSHLTHVPSYVINAWDGNPFDIFLYIFFEYIDLFFAIRNEFRIMTINVVVQQPKEQTDLMKRNSFHTTTTTITKTGLKMALTLWMRFVLDVCGFRNKLNPNDSFLNRFSSSSLWFCFLNCQQFELCFANRIGMVSMGHEAWGMRQTRYAVWGMRL